MATANDEAVVGNSDGLRNVQTVRSHRPPLKEKAPPKKKNHRVNCEKTLLYELELYQ